MDNLDSYIENIANEILIWCELNIITLYNQNKLSVIDNIKNNNNDADNSNIDDCGRSYNKIVTTKGLGFKLLECKDKFPIYSPHILTLACTKLIEKNNIYLDVTSRRVINYLYHDNELNKIINKYIHSQCTVVSAADDNTNTTSKKQKDKVTHTTANTTAVVTMKKHMHTTDLTVTDKVNVNVNAKQKNSSNDNNDEDKSLALMTKKMKIDNKANNGGKITSFFSVSQSKINNDDDDNVKGRGNVRSREGQVNLASSYGTSGSSDESSSRGVVIVENQENHNPLQTTTTNNNNDNNNTSKSTTTSTTFTKTAALSHSTSMLSKSNTKIVKQSGVVHVQDTISKVKMFIPTVVNVDIHVGNNDRHNNDRHSSNSNNDSTSIIHRNDMEMLKHIISSLLSSSLNKKQDEVLIQQLASEVSSTSWTSSYDGSSVVGISKGQLDIILDCFEQENLIMRDGDMLYIL